MSAALDLAQGFLDRLGTKPPPDALEAVRLAGAERFAQSGFPTRRSETWRFSDLKPLIDARFGASVPAPAFALDDQADTLVFIDGVLDPARSSVGSLPDGVTIGSFAAWSAANPAEASALFDIEGGADRAFLSLNAAYFTDGAAILVPDGIALERPIRIIHWNGGAASHLRSAIRLGKGATATVTEHYCGTGAGWTNAAVTIELAATSVLRRYVLQGEADAAFHTAHVAARIGRAARLEGFLLSLGGRISRQDAELLLAGEAAYCGYSGAYVLRGNQESALRSLIRHAAPQGRTHEVFKGCLADRSHGVFQGKILVDRVAQKTDGYQLSKTILLGERAVMDAKPELEIYADDVKCSHGATVGDLDDASIFYLRSRGITPAAARRMLIEAFVQDTVALVEDEAAREWLAAAVTDRLAEFISWA